MSGVLRSVFGCCQCFPLRRTRSNGDVVSSTETTTSTKTNLMVVNGTNGEMLGDRTNRKANKRQQKEKKQRTRNKKPKIDKFSIGEPTSFVHIAHCDLVDQMNSKGDYGSCGVAKPPMEVTDLKKPFNNNNFHQKAEEARDQTKTLQKPQIFLKVQKLRDEKLC